MSRLGTDLFSTLRGDGNTGGVFFLIAGPCCLSTVTRRRSGRADGAEGVAGVSDRLVTVTPRLGDFSGGAFFSTTGATALVLATTGRGLSFLVVGSPDALEGSGRLGALRRAGPSVFVGFFLGIVFPPFLDPAADDDEETDCLNRRQMDGFFSLGVEGATLLLPTFDGFGVTGSLGLDDADTAVGRFGFCFAVGLEGRPAPTSFTDCFLLTAGLFDLVFFRLEKSLFTLLEILLGRPVPLFVFDRPKLLDLRPSPSFVTCRLFSLFAAASSDIFALSFPRIVYCYNTRRTLHIQEKQNIVQHAVKRQTSEQIHEFFLIDLQE